MSAVDHVAETLRVRIAALETQCKVRLRPLFFCLKDVLTLLLIFQEVEDKLLVQAASSDLLVSGSLATLEEQHAVEVARFHEASAQRKANTVVE